MKKGTNKLVKRIKQQKQAETPKPLGIHIVYRESVYPPLKDMRRVAMDMGAHDAGIYFGEKP